MKLNEPWRCSDQERTGYLRGRGCVQKTAAAKSLRACRSGDDTLWDGLHPLTDGSTRPLCSATYAPPCPLWAAQLSSLCCDSSSLWQRFLMDPCAKTTPQWWPQRVHLQMGCYTGEHRSPCGHVELSCSLYKHFGPVLRKCHLYGILLINKTFRNLLEK